MKHDTSAVYVNATRFKCAGDQRAQFPATRRLRCISPPAGDVPPIVGHARVVSSSFGNAETVVDIKLNNGAITPDLSMVSAYLMIHPYDGSKGLEYIKQIIRDPFRDPMIIDFPWEDGTHYACRPADLQRITDIIDAVTLDDVKAWKIRRIEEIAKEKLDALGQSFSQYETPTWSAKVEEALQVEAWVKSGKPGAFTYTTPGKRWLEQEAAASGLPIEVIAGRVLANDKHMAEVSADIFGNRTRLKAKVHSQTDYRPVELIDENEGWPQ